MSKPIGENAHQKTVRLLKKLNDELVEPGSDEQLTINQEPDGSCELVFDRFTISINSCWDISVERERCYQIAKRLGNGQCTDPYCCTALANDIADYILSGQPPPEECAICGHYDCTRKEHVHNAAR